MAGRAGSLWMGDLEPYMDDAFLRQAFSEMGENFRSVKIMKNKFTGTILGYCFLEFDSEETALRVLHKLNGRILPNSSPPKRFKLNHANYNKEHAYTKEFSLFVGDLSLEVDDFAFYKAFASRYPSVRAAKVVLDTSGRSRGFGFIRFADESDQQQALIQMQGYTGLGTKPIRISLATQKRVEIQYQTRPDVLTGPTVTTTPTTTTTAQQVTTQDYSQYYQNYDQYQTYYNQWQEYSQYYNYAYNYGYGYGYGTDYQTGMYGYDTTGALTGTAEGTYEVADITVEEHDDPLDIDKENEEYMKRSEELYTAIEESRWTPLEV
uniref:tRNA selenocysteine-associated protein 1 n=1 Tax=Hemiscolopendra marginata TaxID=943146 RepID=A0A646QD93_9MYRI